MSVPVEGLLYFIVGLLWVPLVHAFVVTAAFLETCRRFQGARPVLCPRTGEAAIIHVGAVRAALAHLRGSSDLRVSHCSRWGENCRDCGESCLLTAAGARVPEEVGCRRRAHPRSERRLRQVL